MVSYLPHVVDWLVSASSDGVFFEPILRVNILPYSELLYMALSHFSPNFCRSSVIRLLGSFCLAALYLARAGTSRGIPDATATLRYCKRQRRAYREHNLSDGNLSLLSQISCCWVQNAD